VGDRSPLQLFRAVSINFNYIIKILSVIFNFEFVSLSQVNAILVTI